MTWNEFYEYASEKLKDRYIQTDPCRIMFGHLDFLKTGDIVYTDLLDGTLHIVASNRSTIQMKLLLDSLL